MEDKTLKWHFKKQIFEHLETNSFKKFTMNIL